ncbi:hypothetical protein HZH68_007643 [Vespula germanica]|uniref:Uncharacterized protein n=1 Tax=Vespula germanica TaxID=30212 RepID=A0A834NBY3_VESGE|nr:hypothetical protein HZH68_007643 [Vespula germanica]
MLGCYIYSEGLKPTKPMLVEKKDGGIEKGGRQVGWWQGRWGTMLWGMKGNCLPYELVLILSFHLNLNARFNADADNKFVTVTKPFTGDLS